MKFPRKFFSRRVKILDFRPIFGSLKSEIDPEIMAEKEIRDKIAALKNLRNIYVEEFKEEGIPFPPGEPGNLDWLISHNEYLLVRMTYDRLPLRPDGLPFGVVRSHAGYKVLMRIKGRVTYIGFYQTLNEAKEAAGRAYIHR